MKIYFNLRNKERLALLIKASVALVFVAIVTYAVFARSDGTVTNMTSTTSQGCYCHTTSSNSNTTLSVSSSSGSFSVYTGSTSTFTVTVSHSSASAAGVNIAVKTTTTGETNAGTLSPESGSGLQVVSNELTHSSPKSFSGGSVSFSFTWTAPSSAGTYYLRAIANAVNGNGRADGGDQWNRMSVQTITVTEAPSITITSPDGGENWCAGSSRNITWTSSGVTNVKIELSTDGGNTFGTTLAASVAASAGTWQWNIPAGQQVADNYRIKITNTANESINDQSNGNFAIAGSAQITSHPQNVEGCTGQPVSFTVGATGGGLTYKWRRNGSDLANSNSATYTITSVTQANAGIYDCVVTGACGSPVTSNSATLTVSETPTITKQPPTQIQICVGQDARLSVNATGTDISFIWRKNGQAIQGAVDSVLNIQQATENDAGIYDVQITGKCPPVRTSTACTLTVNIPPKITASPKSVNVCEGAKAEFSVTATGSQLKYQWRKNGVNIQGATLSKYTIDAVTTDDLATYDVEVSGACDPMAYSETAIINFKPKTEITLQPKNQEVVEGANVDFIVAAKGSNLKYQWRKNGSNLSGKTSANLEIKGVKKTDDGEYDCVITGDCGSITSNKATLKVNESSSGPVLSLVHNSVDFGEVEVSSQKDTLVKGIITNLGNETLTITKISLSGANASEFELINTTLPVSLQKNELLSLNFKFKPTSDGPKNAFVQFESNSSLNPEITLIGVGVEPEIYTNTKVVNFDSLTIGSNSIKTFKITNGGSKDISLAYSITGVDAGLFEIISPESPIDLKSGETADIVVSYNTSSGKQQAIAKIEFTSTSLGKPIEVNLSVNLTTSVESHNNYVSDYHVLPNPSNGIVQINIELNKDIDFELFIADVNGMTVKSFGKINGIVGINKVFWNGDNNIGNNVSSGIYRAIIKSKDNISSFPIVFIK